MEWFEINNVKKIDTPALVLYRDRVKKNIQRAVAAIGNVDHFRPHVKTNKIAEVCRMMMDEGITKFKCATIAEAEMLAMIGAPDVLMAYQPNGPKAERFLQLNIQYPSTHFSCLVDDAAVAKHLSKLFADAGKMLSVFIDLNTGMNRTGIAPKPALALIDITRQLPSAKIVGLHGYDGHVKNPDFNVRKKESDQSFVEVTEVLHYLEKNNNGPITIVSGGSPTFSVHSKRNVECSPGTFVFWDWGYAHSYPEQPFEYAALVITRVISIINKELITLDLGNKAVASENPLPRVHFLNAPDAVPVSHNEEHMGVKVPDSSKYKVGDELYGVPVHICPSVALYDEALVIDDHLHTDTWKVTARGRKINI